MASTPLSQSPLLLRTAQTLSLLPLTLGTIGTLSSTSGYTIFSFPPPTSPANNREAHLFLFWASRDLFMAAVINIAAWNGDRRTLGMVFLAMCGVAGFDAVFSWRVKRGGVGGHLGFLPVLVGVGGGLCGWWDGWWAGK